jgi:hypothetical protein
LINFLFLFSLKDPNIKEKLYDEYIKYGRIQSIKLEGDGEKKVVYIIFKHQKDALKAYKITNSISNKIFHNINLKIDKHVQPVQQQQQYIKNSINYFIDYKNLDEYCSKATRTLFIGNLDRDIKEDDLLERLDKKYGDIINIEIKKDFISNSLNCFNNYQAPQLTPTSTLQTTSTYAFIEFSSIKSVIKAIKCMDGKCIGSSVIRLGFGKVKPTQYVWIDDLSEKMNELDLKIICKHYGTVKNMVIDKQKCQAMIIFTSIEHAKHCVQKLRAKKFHDKRIMIDFASNEFIKKKFDHLLNRSENIETTVGVVVDDDDLVQSTNKIKNSKQRWPVDLDENNIESTKRYHYLNDSGSNSSYQYSNNNNHHQLSAAKPSTSTAGLRHLNRNENNNNNNLSRDSSPHSISSNNKYLSNNKNFNRSNYNDNNAYTNNNENLTSSTRNYYHSKRLSISISRSRSRSRNSHYTSSDSISRSRSNDKNNSNKSPLSADTLQSPTKKHNKKYKCKYLLSF